MSCGCTRGDMPVPVSVELQGGLLHVVKIFMFTENLFVHQGASCQGRCTPWTLSCLCCVVWCGVVWCGVVCSVWCVACGVWLWHGVWHGVVWCVVASGVVWCDYDQNSIFMPYTTAFILAHLVCRDHLQLVSDTMAYQNLPPDFRKDVLSYYKYKFKSTCSVGSTQEDPIDDLPEDLRTKLDWAVGAEMLRRVPIFKEACQNRDFVSMMVQKLQSQALMPDTMVFHRGTMGNCMYFLVNGQVAMCSCISFMCKAIC